MRGEDGVYGVYAVWCLYLQGSVVKEQGSIWSERRSCELEHITYNIVRWEHYSFYILHLDLNTLIPMCCCFHYCHIVMSTR